MGVNTNLENIYLKSMDNKKITFNKKPKIDQFTINGERRDFKSFDIIDKDDLSTGKQVILDVTSFFRCIGRPDEYPNSVLEFFPFYLRRILTPTLIINFPILETLNDLGFCVYCQYYKGYNRTHYKSLKNNNKKVVPYMGWCWYFQQDRHKGLRKIRSKVEGIEISNCVSSLYRCPMWHPNKLYERILIRRLYRFIKTCKGYSRKEYQKDTETIELLHYFFED